MSTSGEYFEGGNHPYNPDDLPQNTSSDDSSDGNSETDSDQD